MRKVEYVGRVPIIPLSKLLNPYFIDESDLDEATKELYAWGRVCHKIIQKSLSTEYQSEVRCIWPQTDTLRKHLRLPFFISAHPDLFNLQTGEVIEIKSSNLEDGALKEQAILQLSSYAHFLHAKKAKIIYYEVVKTKEEEVNIVPLEDLKPLWLEGFKTLVKLGRVILR